MIADYQLLGQNLAGVIEDWQDGAYDDSEAIEEMARIYDEAPRLVEEGSDA